MNSVTLQYVSVISINYSLSDEVVSSNEKLDFKYFKTFIAVKLYLAYFGGLRFLSFQYTSRLILPLLLWKSNTVIWHYAMPHHISWIIYHMKHIVFRIFCYVIHKIILYHLTYHLSTYIILTHIPYIIYYRFISKHAINMSYRIILYYIMSYLISYIILYHIALNYTISYQVISYRLYCNLLHLVALYQLLK